MLSRGCYVCCSYLPLYGTPKLKFAHIELSVCVTVFCHETTVMTAIHQNTRHHYSHGAKCTWQWQRHLEVTKSQLLLLRGGCSIEVWKAKPQQSSFVVRVKDRGKWSYILRKPLGLLSMFCSWFLFVRNYRSRFDFKKSLQAIFVGTVTEAS